MICFSRLPRLVRFGSQGGGAVQESVETSLLNGRLGRRVVSWRASLRARPGPGEERWGNRVGHRTAASLGDVPPSYDRGEAGMVRSLTPAGGADMNYFAGLDASLEWTSACVVHTDGGIVREAKVASEPAGPRGVLHRAGLRRDAHLLEAVRADPVCRRLMTVPGAGPVTALIFRASVDVPSRFARSRWAALRACASQMAIRRGRPNGKNLQVRGRDDARGALRSGQRLARAHDAVVMAESLCDGCGEASRQGAGEGCARPASRRHHAPHVDGRRRVPLVARRRE